jgi:hypothetical protein
MTLSPENLPCCDQQCVPDNMEGGVIWSISTS